MSIKGHGHSLTLAQTDLIKTCFSQELLSHLSQFSNEGFGYMEIQFYSINFGHMMKMAAMPMIQVQGENSFKNLLLGNKLVDCLETWHVAYATRSHSLFKRCPWVDPEFCLM